MKICTKCNVSKSLDQFHKHKNTKSGIRAQCKECRKENRKDHYETHKDRILAVNKTYYYNNLDKNKDYTLRREYGITLEQYNKMFASQNGQCFICQTHACQLKKALCVDHCHKTSKVRGLLCHRCNSLIGMANENLHLLESAQKYLRFFKS